MDIFLNQLIQFYSDKAANLHHLTSHNIEIVIWPQIYCDVTSPMYTASKVVTLWRDRNA